MFVDFQEMNKITVNSRYPLSIIDDLLDQLKNVVYFTNMDMKSGYHQIKILENDVWKISLKIK